MTQKTTKGRSSPLGATLSPEGANFSVFSKHATGIDLLLFDNVDDACPSSVIRIDPATNRTYHNGEGNRDGAEDNRSWNCGAEGPSNDPAVEKLRNRQVKNFLTITMLSAGIPMILMGDEVRRTQFGNNNAYCQDNETSWFDWRLLAKHADVHRFVTLLNARRRLRSTEIERQRISLNRLLRGANLTWHGVKVGQPDWRMSSHSIALTVEIPDEGLTICLIANAYWETLDFELPQIGRPGISWRRWINTALDSPQDIVHWEAALPAPSSVVQAEPRSVIVFLAEARGGRN